MSVRTLTMLQPLVRILILVTAFGPDTHPCYSLRSGHSSMLQPSVRTLIHITAFGPDSHQCYSLRSGHSPCYSLRSGHSSMLQPSVRTLIHVTAFGPDTHPCYSLRSGHSSILPALNLQPAATREPDGLWGNQTLSSWAPDDGHNAARNMLSLT